jgi:hypothetical protein
VFPNIPKDSITNIVTLNNAGNVPTNPEQLEKVKGNLLNFPMNFLRDEDLSPTFHLKADSWFQ